ncbi:MAG TPA: hypothetical protein VGP72_10270 [Planctomycetota bacterium]
MDRWRKQLRFDPLPALLASRDDALRYFARRDLLGERAGDVRLLWDLPEARKMLKKQQPDGSWPRAGAEKHPAINYRLIETWRHFRFLVGQYGYTREHPQAAKAAEFLFSCQTRAGDFRGFLANQYATYYSGAIMALLIEAGFGNDRRIERGFQWLLAMRQADGGWTIPLLTHKLDRATLYRVTSEYAEPLEPDRSKPFSHNWTGMVLRAFAAHERYRKSDAARAAARLLVSRFFQADAYTSYHSPSYWVRFEYPFWWSNLVSALDSVSLIGTDTKNEPINTALNWFVEHQGKDGLWNVSYVKPCNTAVESARIKERKLWVTLAICRVLRRLIG